MKLSYVLWFKIVITIILWCTPLLFFPQSCFRHLGVPPPDPIIFAKLLGAAFLALVVVYWHGLTELRRGKRPVVVIRAGLVSNGLAAGFLILFGVAGSWQEWSLLGCCYMWFSTVAAAGITVGLLVGKP